MCFSLLKIDQVETKCDVPQKIIMICVTHVQDFEIRTIIIDKILNFQEIAQNFPYSQKSRDLLSIIMSFWANFSTL